MWPCVVAPGEADVGRTGSSSVALLHGLCSSATWNHSLLLQKTNVTHIHTNISPPSENHTVLSKPGGRTTSKQVTGVLITPHSRWAASHFLRPKKKKKTHVHCRWLTHFTDRRVVISPGVGRNERWCEDPVNVSRSSHCCSVHVLPAAVHTMKQTRGCRRPPQLLLFLILNQLLLEVTGISACSQHVQSAHWTHSGIQNECSDCINEFTVKVPQAMMSWIWVSSWWSRRVLRLRLCARECPSIVTIAPVRQEGHSKKEEEKYTIYFDLCYLVLLFWRAVGTGITWLTYMCLYFL